MSSSTSSFERRNGSHSVWLGGLLLSVVIGVLSLLPAAWFVAVLILFILAMPAFLLAEPMLRRLYGNIQTG